jgi:arylsulfatase A-like enzyme
MKKNIVLPCLVACGLPVAHAENPEKPNIIVIYIDDMGFSDLACYGGNYTPTPNMDKLAEEGIRFTQYYTACPISSPSRTGITTGMYPTRWGITTYLQTRAGNAAAEQNDFLDDKAPSMARALKANGYVTGHFGKWHMGGGRDVSNAPSITNYGFDEYVSTWESPDPDPKLTATNWIWSDQDEIKRWNRTAYFVDKTLDFLQRHPDDPCFINLWPDDVHTPWVYETDGGGVVNNETAATFSVVLAELDVQIGRLMEGLKTLGIDEKTLVIFTSDNGPAPAFSGGRTDNLRGQKATLYEGGIRMPFIVRWPGTIASEQINDSSIVCSVDLFPSLCAIAGASVPDEFPLDGEDMSRVLLGIGQTERTKPLFWEFGKNVANQVSPHIAVRDGDWKLLVNANGSRVELYNMKTDYLEKSNVASANPEVVARLKPMAINWFKASFREFADHIIHVAVDGDATEDGSSWEKATTLAHAVTLAPQFPEAVIWLKTGTYSVASSINCDNVAIYGGFAGTEQTLNERNWNLYPAILDGGGTVSPLRSVKLTASDGGTLDGVIVQNGLSPAGANGGGMILSGGSVIRNCIFRNNRTQTGRNGAAFHCHLGVITAENCLFVNNTSLSNGGAIQIGGDASATVVNCTFANNQSTTGPGGAFGLGAATSHLTLYNTVAWNNKYGENYSSYGQNTNVNGGGTVISQYSAIESVSTKFTDGNDEAHTALTREITPDFVSPATVIGYTANADEITQIEAASYCLADNSLCIDAGNAGPAQNLLLDLGGQVRISGNQVDIGAYEYNSGFLPDDVRIVRAAANGDETEDGSSWEKATTLTNAVALANSFINETQIWLKAGTYPITASINFDNLAIYGGFDGSEEQLNERDWAQNPVILDGGNAVSPLRNSLEATVSSLLDGVTIQNGLNHASANGNGNGGGMILAGGATVRNCIFRNNRTQNAKNGAALHCHAGAVTIENCLFVNNTSSGNGGAMQVGGGTSATVVNCTFANNRSTTGPGGAFGLGTSDSNLTLLNTVAWNNQYGQNYSSYGQNADVNGGGTVISRNSAIESVSTKFTDGNDEAHISLTREITPDFVSPATVIGYTADAAEITQIEAASYCLADNSPCIDAGNTSLAPHLDFDLRKKHRVAGSSIDVGAYEFDPITGFPLFPASPKGVRFADGEIQITGAKGNTLKIYSINGALLHRSIIGGATKNIPWTKKGFHLIKIENQVYKLFIH